MENGFRPFAGLALDLSTLKESNHPALWYQPMLADDLRMRRYRRAIERVVKPGDVVADLGTGTGVLALMALNAGAARIYAIDRQPRALWIAERLIRANGAADRVVLIEGDAARVILPEPVDVVVNELIGDFGTDEEIFAAVAGFAAGNLKPGARMLPRRLRTYLVAAEYDREFRGVWCRDNAGIDLRAAVDLPCRGEAVMYGLRRRPRELAGPVLLEDIVFGPAMGHRPTTREVALTVESDGVLQGFVGYFDATLAGRERLRPYPCWPSCHWRNWHWPVSPPLAVRAGQRIAATLTMTPGVSALGWSLAWTLR